MKFSKLTIEYLVRVLKFPQETSVAYVCHIVMVFNDASL